MRRRDVRPWGGFRRAPRPWAGSTPVFAPAPTRAGFAGHVGHLFEAEDESQAWPDLQDAIREARKAYQATSSLPDVDSLARFACRQRQAES